MANEEAGAWFSFQSREESNFDNETVHACYLSKLFYIEAKRTSYHGNLSCRDRGLDSFCRELRTAMDRIEGWRNLGTHWTILELPVIVISGIHHWLIVGETGHHRPLSHCLPLRKSLPSLNDIGEYCIPRWGSRALPIVCRTAVTPAAPPFYRHESSPRGMNHPLLSWHSRVAKIDLSAVVHLIARINDRLQPKEARRKAIFKEMV